MSSSTTKRRIGVREDTMYRWVAVAHCDETGKVTVEFEPICGWVDYEVSVIEEKVGADGSEYIDRDEWVESTPLVFDGDTATEMFFDTALGVAMHGDGKDWLGMAEKMFGTDAATVKRAMGVN